MQFRFCFSVFNFINCYFTVKDKLEDKMTERELLNLEDEAKFFKLKELVTLVSARLDNIGNTFINNEIHF